jgi:hypothetical protein
MKKLNVFLLVFLLLSSIGFISCDNEECLSDVPLTLSKENSEISDYFLTDGYKAFLSTNALKNKDIQLDSIKKDTFSTRNVVEFSIIVKKDGINCGYLHVFSKNRGLEYRAIFEKINDSGNTTSIASIMTDDGEFIASLETTKKGSLYKTKILEVADVSDTVKTRRAKNESYGHCVARVFKTAKAACDDDATCALECAAADILGKGSCTGSMIAAAGVVCM